MSAWSDFTDAAVELGTAGANAYKNWTTPQNTGVVGPTQTTTTTTTTKSALPSWLLPVGIGVAVLGLVLFLVNRKS